jgi:DNA-binding transcriptional regulator YiaG
MQHLTVDKHDRERLAFGQVMGILLTQDELLAQVRARRSLPSAAERRRIREEAGVSLRDVAAVLGVSHSLVRHWELGGTPRKQRAAYGDLLEELRRLNGPTTP